jgi:hypothetical protein
MRRSLLVLLFALGVSLQAASVTVLPEQVRGTLAFGHVGDASPTPLHVSAGTPANNGNYNFTIESSVWPTTPGLTMRVVIEKSTDGGATWGFMMGNDPADPTDHAISAQLDKFGVPALDRFGTVWSGEAMDLRGTFTPGSPFSWGVSAQF